MASQLSSVVGIVDVDGFMINKVFYCKELGMIKVGDAVGRSFFFDLVIQWRELSEKDKKSCRYVMGHIHKLPFDVPYGVRARKLSALGSIVREFYREIKRDANSILAYKGGQCERELLTGLGIPSFNLENIGCPKAEVAMEQLVWLETCWRHTAPIARRSKWRHLNTGCKTIYRCFLWNKKFLLNNNLAFHSRDQLLDNGYGPLSLSTALLSNR